MTILIKAYTRAHPWSKRRLIRAKGFGETSVMPRVNCDAPTHGG
jgi:hypothetical protein